MMPVRWLTSRSRTRCNACRSSCSAVFVATNFIVGRCTASAIASASRKSFFCPLLYGRTYFAGISRASWPSACSLRLMTVPGIGPIISSATVAAIGNGAAFSKGRDFGAWLGLVPKQISTGDRTILGKISRRGNRYLRSLFVQAAWVVLVRVGPKHWDRYGLKSWIEAAKKRLHHNVLAIALANKLARIAWAVLNKERKFECIRTNKMSPRAA